MSDLAVLVPLGGLSVYLAADFIEAEAVRIATL